MSASRVDYSQTLASIADQRTASGYDEAEASKGLAQGYTPDYSYQLAVAGGDKMAANGLGHFTDKGKLPNHPTFSIEAVLGTPATAGVWSTEYTGEGRLGDVFTPSQKQLATPGYTDSLQNYYNREKGRGIDMVNIPAPYKQVN